jgi:membrane protease YdiL (CAAX protease family)
VETHKPSSRIPAVSAPKPKLLTMKNIINWKLFFILLTASVIVTLLVLPFMLELSPKLAKVFTLTMLITLIIQALIEFSIAIFLGLYLARRVGFGMPVLEGEMPISYIKSISKLSVGMGILGAVLVILFSLPFMSLSLSLLKAEMSVATWKAFLAAFDGGIAEEILFRLFLMTLFVWISSKVKKTREGGPTLIGIWLSIVLSSVLFGLGHLGITSDLTAITSVVILRAVLLNGVVGIIFGWLYWKKGLESAMIAHFSSDIVLHVITPTIASLFIHY